MPRTSGPGRHHPRGQEPLDLRGEEEPIALSRPEKRADAEPVPGQDQAALTTIPKGQGELAAQVFEHRLAVVFPQVGDQLRVAVGAEPVPLALQLGLALGIVEQLAVEDDGDGSVFVEDRLLAVGQADDAEPPRRQPNARLDKPAFLVRPPVIQGLGHRLKGRLWNGLPSCQINESRDSAH